MKDPDGEAMEREWSDVGYNSAEYTGQRYNSFIDPDGINCVNDQLDHVEGIDTEPFFENRFTTKLFIGGLYMGAVTGTLIVFFMKFVRWIHRISSVFTDFLSGMLIKITGRLEKKRWFKSLFEIFGIVQVVAVVVVFMFSRNRFRLFCDVLYTTPAGAVAGMLHSMAQQMEINTSTAFVLGVFGDSFSWVTCGIQTIFAAWYSGILEKYENSRIKKIINWTAFTFFIGILLTNIIQFLLSADSLLMRLADIPVLGTLLYIIIIVIIAIMFIIALDTGFSNLKEWALTVFALTPVIILISVLLENISGPEMSVPQFYNDHVEEIMELGVLGMTLLGNYLSGIFFKKRKKTQQQAEEEYKQERLKRRIRSVVDKKAELEYPLDSCCICHRTFEGGYALLYKSDQGREVRIDSSCYNALNALANSNDPNYVQQALQYMSAVLPMTDSNIKNRVKPFVDRGKGIVYGRR